jgi:hypothetical protein
LLCELGNNRGVGFDPSHENLAKGNQAAAQVSFIRDFYSEHYANYQADLICCRHALEHIYDPTDFVSMLRRSISDRSKTILYVEVPNVLLILRDLSIWDIIYEHCSYFCRESLAHLFRSCGFDVLDLKEAYEGQFLAVEACPHREASDYERDPLGDLRELSSYVAAFADSYRVKMDSWQSCLDVIEHAGRRAVLWGAGAKAVSFLNTLKAEGRVEYVVDINPRKQGMHIAGTGQRIVPPDFLREYRPDVAIVMNPVYMSEIQGTVAELGLTTELVCA